MVRVKKGELSQLRNNTTIVNLSELSTSLKTAARKFDNFANYSNKRLQGEGYDAIRDVARYLSALCSTVSSVDEYAYSSIRSSAAEFINYMENYDKLDDSRLNSIKAELKHIISRIDTLESIIKNFDGEDDLSNVYGQIEYWHSIYDKITKEYNKLKELSSVSATTGACLDNINDDINNIVNRVSRSIF